MSTVEPLHLAENIKDLEKLVSPQSMTTSKSKNVKMLQHASKKLYQTVNAEKNDEELCFIYCLRYMYIVDRLCRIDDEKFYKLLYKRELETVANRINELRRNLEARYAEKHLQDKLEKKKTGKQAVPIFIPPENVIHQFEPFISVKDLYIAVKNKADMLIVDIRPAQEYQQSQIKFENVINIPEDLIEFGQSANIIEQKLKDETEKLWNKRDGFTLLVFLDWNSGTDNVISSKLNFLKASIVDWDVNRKYQQQPVILNGGFKDFVDSYPTFVTNVHVNYIRNNEDIDELLELDNISYPDANISVMELKEFTINGFEDSAQIEETEQPPISNIPQPPAEQIPDKNSTEIIPSKTIDKPSNDEYFEEIQNKIEEDRQRLLIEARSKKNIHNLDDNKTSNENYNRIIPPPIRREIKPQKSVVAFGGWCGLVNIKNTCYMNTILQCLKCIPVIRHLIHTNIKQFITKRPTQIIHEFSNVIKALCEGTEFDKRVYQPSGFYDIVCRLDPIYKKGNHEDCMEFFLFLFNYLNEDCARDIKKKNVMIEREKSWYAQLQGRTSIWVDLFYHQFQCTKICLTCHSKADTYETDNTLMLSVPYRPSLRMVHLNDLIRDYVEDNPILDYKCSKCHKMKVINRKRLVVEPEILVIVLKRYYQDEYQETRKNNVLIDFDLTFQFGNYLYKLYSVAQHRGTMEHGHYYGHGLLNNNVWIEFNDTNIMKLEKEWDSIRGSVCAFFYCKEKMNRI